MTQMTSLLHFAVFAAALSLTTSSASAQQPIQQPIEDPAGMRADAVNEGLRLSAGLQLGFAGEASIGGFDADLDPSFGVQGQVHFPIGRFFLLGGSLAFRSLKIDGADDRSNVFAVGPSFGGHYAIDVGPVVVDPFVLATIGLAVAFSNDLQTDTELGIDFGIRGGAHVWFTDRLGAYLAFGYQREDIFIDSERSSGWQLHTDIGVTFSL
ncbi:MAG: hypothetical protein AAF938_16455 [Myxococcota bacterium]